jgi:hypothetical protein
MPRPSRAGNRKKSEPAASAAGRPTEGGPIRLNFQIDQKDRYLLDIIKSFIGGNISYRVSTNCYYYGSTNFGSAIKIINYFDSYHLLSSKYLNFFK